MTPSDTFAEVTILTTAYLIGSLPCGLFVSWLFNLADPRTVGSKNMGATNILRSGHKGAAALTLLLDVFKGSLAVLMAGVFAPPLLPLAGILVVVGHIWPLWLKFRGGKGIATAFGVLLVLSWPLALLCLVTWLMVALTTHYSSLASLLTVVLSPLYTALLSRDDLVILCLTLALFIVWSHRRNIERLLTGREPKIGKPSPKDIP